MHSKADSVLFIKHNSVNISSFHQSLAQLQVNNLAILDLIFGRQISELEDFSGERINMGGGIFSVFNDVVESVEKGL